MERLISNIKQGGQFLLPLNFKCVLIYSKIRESVFLIFLYNMYIKDKAKSSKNRCVHVYDFD